MNKPSRSFAAVRGAAVFAFLISAAPGAFADVIYLSRSWTATGGGKLVDPGFPDMTDSYTTSGTASFNDRLMTLRNFPNFSSDHNWINQTMIADIDDVDPGAFTPFHIHTRALASLNGPGVAVDGESTITLLATVLVTSPQLYNYDVSANGDGDTAGLNYRSSRLTLTPSGGSPIINAFVESFSDERIGSTSGLLTLSPGTYDIAIELTYEMHQADFDGPYFESVASAEINWRIPAPSSALLLPLATALATARRRR